MNAFTTTIIILVIIAILAIVYYFCRPSANGKGLSKPIKQNRQLRKSQQQRQDSDIRIKGRVDNLGENNNKAGQLIGDARKILEGARYIEPMGED